MSEVNQWMVWGYCTPTGEIKPPFTCDHGKTQETIVNEALEALENRDNDDIIFIQGGVGTGKSVIALHLAAYYGKSIITVPFMNLEKQYTDNYCGSGKPYIQTPDGRLDVNNLRGRANFYCLYQASVKCNDRYLPCTIPLEPTCPKCGAKVKVSDKECPRCGATGIISTSGSRYEIALNCKHWSPVYSSGMVPDEVNQSRAIHTYLSTGGRKTYCEAAEPCPYYRQFRAYIPQGAIIMNDAKWEIETWIKRKPAVQLEIIDEADYFLDGLSYQTTINRGTLIDLRGEGVIDQTECDSLERDLVELVEISRREKQQKALKLTSSPRIRNYIQEISNRLEKTTSSNLVGTQQRLSLIIEHQEYSWFYAKTPSTLIIFIPRMDITLRELRKRSGGKLVMMSATRHSDQVMHDMYGVQPHVILAKEENPGTLYLMTPRDGRLLEVTHTSWEKKPSSPAFRARYWDILDYQLSVAPRPCYVIVHAYKYLPEKYKPGTGDGDQESWAFSDLPDVYFSTKIDRGKDLPDDKCRAIILLKYPIPNTEDVIFKTIESQYGTTVFWEYVYDHADRNLLQQCGRAIRGPNDWCEIYSPDKKAIRKLERIWKGRLIKKSYPPHPKGGLIRG